MSRFKTTLGELITCSFMFFALTSVFAYADSLQVPSITAAKAHKSLLVNSVLAGNRIFTVGGRGHVLFSDDHGQSWQQANSPTQRLLTAIDFADEKHGWAVGHDSVILGTEDGGKNWSILFEAPEKEQPLLDVLFFDKENGLVAGAYGLIMRTGDGGKTWHEFMIEEIDMHFNSLQRIGDAVVIAGEAGTLIRSLDRGKTWQVLESPYAGSFFGALSQPVAGGHNIIIFGLRGNAFISNNLGNNWQKMNTGVSTNILGGTLMPSGKTILLGAGGTVLLQNRESSSFERVPYRGFENLTSGIAVTDSELAVFGARGVSILKVR